MKKIFYILLFLLCFAPFSNAEVYVDYVPGSLKNQQSLPEKNPINDNQVKIQTEKVPALPAHLKNAENLSGSNQKIAKRTEKQVKKSTQFEIKSSQKISDKTKKNTKVKFTTTKNQQAGVLIFPAGTVFSGHVIQSHAPQMTSNGGLVKIVIDEIIYQNISNETDAKILTANGKNIYFNAIKGERKYLNNTKNNMKWGITTFKKNYKRTSAFSKKGGWYWIITPIPAIWGTFAVSANAVYAPVAAIFQKGGSVSFNAGSKFTIKLNQDTQIYVLDNL